MALNPKQRNVWKLGAATIAAHWGALIIYPDTMLFLLVDGIGISAILIYVITVKLNRKG